MGNCYSVANSKNFYNELDKEAWYKKYPPDKISDMPLDIEDLWDKLKVAQFEEQLEIQKNGGSQKLPDADYMKAQCELYRDLAKNQIARAKRPVIFEQLHWLDMNTMSKINEDDDENVEENVQSVRDKREIDRLLMKYTVPLEELEEKEKSSKKDEKSLKEFRKWIKEKGVFHPTLSEIEKEHLDCSNESKVATHDLKEILEYFKSYYAQRSKKADTFKKLENRLKEDDNKYTFDDSKGNRFRFLIMSVDAGSHIIYQIFCRAKE